MAKEPSYRLPNDQQHIAIIGRNGTGKTLAALWHLSQRDLRRMPWVIVDFKRDEHINAIKKAQYIETGVIPKKPGVYIVQPNASDPQPLAETFSQAYEKGDTGFWIDEGFLMGRNKEVEERFIDLLTQGRSKHIPIIVLVQRPVWVSRFVFSESSFFQMFHLQDGRDVNTVSEVVQDPSAFRRLPDFHSSYYDVGADEVTFLSPVPPEQEILSSIDSQLPEPSRLRFI
jgi:hypothetical protein